MRATARMSPFFCEARDRRLDVGVWEEKWIIAMAMARRGVFFLEAMETIFAVPVEVRWVKGVKGLESSLEVGFMEVVLRERHWTQGRKGRERVVCL